MKKSAFLCVIMVCLSILSGCGAGYDVSSEQTVEKNIKYVTNDNAVASMIEAEQEAGSEIPDSDTGDNAAEDNDTEENDTEENNYEWKNTLEAGNWYGGFYLPAEYREGGEDIAGEYGADGSK